MVQPAIWQQRAVRAGIAVLVAAGAAARAQAAPGRAPQRRASPFARLFDTRRPLPAALPANAPAGQAGWTRVSEGVLSHRFAGDAVALNDRLAVVVGRSGGAAEICARGPDGWQSCAALLPCGAAGRRAARLAALQIAENSPAAVTLNAAFRTADGQSTPIAVRLTAGAPFLEVRPGKGTARLFVRDRAEYIVVPDLFADDFVLRPGGLGPGRTGLPAENVLLSLTAGGGAIVVCVWPSNEQNADAIAGRGPQGTIEGCEIDCGPKRGLWIAVLAGRGIWHGRKLAAGPPAKRVVLDWRAPFHAKWRCSLAGADGPAASWEMPPSAAPAAQAGTSIGLPAGAEGRALVVYPLDRSRTTPLSVFCPIDILRNTLGVGVCQYVLAMEGLGAEGEATAAAVTAWVERQFERKRQRRQAAAIRERLARMTALMRRTQARIDEYGRFFRDVRAACEAAAGEAAPAAAKLLGVLDEARRATARDGGATGAAETAAPLAGRIVALTGQTDPLADCRKLAARIRAAGAAQERALARLRMGARRLKQRCRTLAAVRGPGAEFAAKIRRRAEQILRKQQPAPQTDRRGG